MSAANICAACHQELPVRPRGAEQRAAFAMGTLLAAVPLWFQLTSPGATHPGLWARLAIWAGGGVAGALLQRRHRRARHCPVCR